MREKSPSKKKKRLLKPRVMDALGLIGGLVIGEVIAALTQNVGFLKWLSYDVVIGFEQPLVLNFILFKIAFGFSIHLNPAVVLFALLGLVMGRYLRTSQNKKLSVPAPAEEEGDEQ